MKEHIEGKTILVTGGTGSLARPLIRELLLHNPKTVRVLDIDETEQFEMQHEFADTQNKLRFLLGDIRDKERLRIAMEGVDIVFHLAALKHVLACEYNPFEAVKTNVLGTQNIIEVALEHEIEKVIYTSSDKAVNPNNTMGATKLLAERLVTAANHYKGSKKTVFASVRFGNILWSRGSIGPLFSKQVAQGGPVTLTHPDMTRFFMSPKKAVNLLFESMAIAQGGEIFVFKMPTIRIEDFVKAFIAEFAPKYGHDPATVEVKTIGPKPGETMSEELMTTQEADRAYEVEDLYVIAPQIQFNETHLETISGIKKAEISHYDSQYETPLQLAEIRSILSSDNPDDYL